MVPVVGQGRELEFPVRQADHVCDEHDRMLVALRWCIRSSSVSWAGSLCWHGRALPKRRRFWCCGISWRPSRPSRRHSS
jgi:hypothetical protein